MPSVRGMIEWWAGSIFLLIPTSPWIFWCAEFVQWQHLRRVLIADWWKVVMGFPVWAICIVSSMIASWFSIARKCEELPLQRHVCPTSTNPQLMASRSNRPHQPHILHKFHVHNSLARFKKKQNKYTQQTNLWRKKKISVSKDNSKK